MINNRTYQLDGESSRFVPRVTSSPAKSLVVLYGENNLDISPSRALLTVTPRRTSLKKDSASFSSAKWKHVEKCRGVSARFTNAPPPIDQSNELALETNNFSDFKASTSVVSSIGELQLHQHLTELSQFSFVSATCVKNENFSRSNNVQRLHFEAGN